MRVTGATIESSARRRLGVGAAIVLVLAAAAVAIGVGVVRSAASGTTEDVVIVATATEPPILYVHVSGAVHAPGLYRLVDGARVVDVIAAAGGMTDDADASSVNLARRLSDGEQLQVPVVGESPPAGSAGSGGSGAGSGLVNLNTADVAELDALPRIGPAIAQRIIDWREANGAFTSVDDLLAVSGIGEKMLASLRDLVTV